MLQSCCFYVASLKLIWSLMLCKGGDTIFSPPPPVGAACDAHRESDSLTYTLLILHIHQGVTLCLLSCSWANAAVDVQLPQGLAVKLEVHLRRARPVLCPGSPFVFCRPDGSPMSESIHMTNMWSSIMRKDLGSDSKIPPHM